MKQRDIVSVARTGSGKTCAFLLPAIHRIVTEKSMAQKDFEGQMEALGSKDVGEVSDREKRRRKRMLERGPPRVLILAPTRELCSQIGTLVAL
jgi:ATP-dependent RNA helicase DDX5/DBP2